MNLFNMALPPVPKPDIPEGDGFNGGEPGVPPGANYPQ
jgi:hypothetical protein